MDIVRLYQDFSIPFVTEGHKHSRAGWANVECPYCEGNPGYHLGFEIENPHFYCFRCGWHPVIPTIGKLIKKSDKETRRIISEYGLHLSLTKTPALKSKKEHILPTGTGPLTSKHIRYLDARGFDHIQVSNLWTLAGTGPVSRLDNIDFKHRLIIPIIWDSQEVSFTSRDITGKTPMRYITCPKDREVIHHKHIVYGRQEYWQGVGIWVEGPTDVWRLGVNSFSTFGIEYTREQLRVIARTFKRVFVLFDQDPQAQVQSRLAVAELRFRGVDAIHLENIISQDPGDMSQAEADYLVKQLIT